MRNAIRFLLLAAVATGCATAPAPIPLKNPEVVWASRQDALRQVTAWRIQGRLAMRADDRGWHSSLSWVRHGGIHRLDLTGPLGRGHLRLAIDANGAELQDADRHVWRAPNAEQLLQRETGWRLPLDGMHYWILGLPEPASKANQALDGQGRLRSLIQSGWHIQYLEYTHSDSLDLPSKIFIKRQDARPDEGFPDDAAIEVRLQIERWAIN